VVRNRPAIYFEKSCRFAGTCAVEDALGDTLQGAAHIFSIRVP